MLGFWGGLFVLFWFCVFLKKKKYPHAVMFNVNQQFSSSLNYWNFSGTIFSFIIMSEYHCLISNLSKCFLVSFMPILQRGNLIIKWIGWSSVTRSVWWCQVWIYLQGDFLFHLKSFFKQPPEKCFTTVTLWTNQKQNDSFIRSNGLLITSDNFIGFESFWRSSSEYVNILEKRYFYLDIKTWRGGIWGC